MQHGRKRTCCHVLGDWWLELQDYDFTVQCKAGARMQHVDALSRNALPVMHITETNWVLAVQNDDPKIQTIVANIKSPEFKDLYMLKDNILYRKVGVEYKIVIPKSVRWRVTKTFHDDNGHMNDKKVTELIQREYWFEKLRRFVSKYVRGCISCQFAKTPTGKRQGYLNPRQYSMAHVAHRPSRPVLFIQEWKFLSPCYSG